MNHIVFFFIIKNCLTKPAGTVLFSNYSKKFWDELLCWFYAQAEKELIGEIDYDRTHDGIIICKDGFKAITFNYIDFERIVTDISYELSIC